MTWTLTVGGADMSSVVQAGASFVEIASSSGGQASFTLIGKQDSVVLGAAISLVDPNGKIAWEGTVSTVYPQTDRSGIGVATRVAGTPLAGSFAVSVPQGNSGNEEVAVLAKMLCGVTAIPWGGPASFGVMAGSLSFTRADSGLSILSALCGRTWRVQNGHLVFVSPADGLTSVPFILPGIQNTASTVTVSGGLDAVSRMPLDATVQTIGNPGGPAVFAADSELADANVVQNFADALAVRYGDGSISGSTAINSTVRAGDWLIDQGKSTAIVWQTQYQLIGGTYQASVQFGFPTLPTNPQYSAAFSDAAHRNPIARLHGDYHVKGGDVTFSGLTATLTQAVIALNDVQYTLSGANVTLPSTGVSFILGLSGGFSTTTTLSAPVPGSALILYRVTTNNGILVESRDLRTRGGINAIHLQPPVLPAPTFSSPTASGASSSSGVTSDVTVTATLTNVPTDGTVVRVAWFIRTNGVTPWNMWAESALSGLPAPPASQTQSMIYAALTNGAHFDFGAAFVGVREDIGPVATLISNYTPGPIALPITALPTIPAGTTVSVGSATINSYGVPTGGVFTANVTFTPTVTPPVGDPRPFSQWGSGYLFWAKPNDTGTSDGDTNVLHYVQVGSYSQNTTGSAITTTFGPLGAGHGWQLAVQPIDQQGSGGALGIAVVTVVQQIGNTTLLAMPSGIKSAGPTISTSSITTARATSLGSAQRVGYSFTETDFTSPYPTWLAGIWEVVRLNGIVATQAKVLDYKSSSSGVYTGNAAAPFGQSIDIGFFYTDMTGAASATVFPAALSPIPDPGGNGLDGLPDGSNRSGILVTETNGATGSRTIKRLNDGTNVRTAQHVADIIADNSGRGQADLSNARIVNKTLDNIADTTTRSGILTSETNGAAGSRTVKQVNDGTNVRTAQHVADIIADNAGRGQADLGNSRIINKNLDNISDTATRSGILTSETSGGAGSRTIKQLNDGTYTRTVTNVAAVVDASNNIPSTGPMNNLIPNSSAFFQDFMYHWSTNLSGTHLNVWYDNGASADTKLYLPNYSSTPGDRDINLGHTTSGSPSYSLTITPGTVYYILGYYLSGSFTFSVSTTATTISTLRTIAQDGGYVAVYGTVTDTTSGTFTANANSSGGGRGNGGRNLN